MMIDNPWGKMRCEFESHWELILDYYFWFVMFIKLDEEKILIKVIS